MWETDETRRTTKSVWSSAALRVLQKGLVVIRGRTQSDLQSVLVIVFYLTLHFHCAMCGFECCVVTRVVLVYCGAL